ncbi:MAG: TonB-dependent receptor [Flammeovirgaceae bacterium]|nr:TonB-dependent receptor [Flammeovirgaceae bacterium]
MKKLLLTLLSLYFFHFTIAQNLSQTVRGTLLDSDTKFPLIGASILVLSDSTERKVKGATADINGDFRINNVPIGRHSFKITSIGYKDAVLNNIVVSSAKEVVLNVELEESALAIAEVEITATRDGEISNEMVTVSAREFSIEETERYAGSRGDPARMASNFAGVQGADDSRNDIVIRGNSPLGVVWQLDGINIPNPNHFNIPGTTGGPVTILNNKVLANSDFYTGAFPAEFGNSVAGVFGLKMRNGNNEKWEYSFQLGFLGTEVFAEGPLSKKSKASMMFSYRYSTLALFGNVGFNIGTSAIPKYQDINFKMNFPLKNGASLSFFGMGGLSDIDILISDQKEPEVNIYGDNDRDQYFTSNMGITGLTYKHPINKSTYLQASLAASHQKVVAHHNLVNRHVEDGLYVVDSLSEMLDYKFRENKLSVPIYLYKKFDKKNSMDIGVNTDIYGLFYIDSLRNLDEQSPDFYSWRLRWNSETTEYLVQPYLQWKHKFTDQFYVVAGIHAQYFSLGNALSAFEPRLGLKWELNGGHRFGIGIGKHSQHQPLYTYFYGQENDVNGNPLPHNIAIGFSKSNHYVLSYDKLLGSNFRLKIETYFQDLYEIPVEQKSSSLSYLNSGAGFSRLFPDTLQNTGTGKNYGLEVTLEKFFSNHYLFMITGSLYDAKYKGSDGIERNTEFNGNYILNGLFTKEFVLKTNKRLSIGGKATLSGGRRYGPVDEKASEKQREIVYVDETRNSLQFDDYFRADLKINYKIDRPKVSHEIAMDLVNIFDTQNILKLTYAPDESDPTASPIREEYQLGFLPVFYYRIDF